MAENAIDREEIVERFMKVPSADEDDEESIDLRDLIRILYNGRRTILGVTLGIFLVATVIAFMLPPSYTSVVTFIPPNPTGGGSMATALAGQLSALGGGDMFGAGKTSGDLYAGILRSQSIAGELVKHFQLAHVYRVKKESQAEERLISNTSIEVDPKSTIVTVSVTDGDPSRAREIANRYMDDLRETNGRLALSQSSQRRLFFGQQLAKEKDDLENAEIDLRKTEETSGLIAPGGQTEAEIRTIADTQAQVAVREVQLAALRQSATEQNPEVIRLRSEVEDLQGQLARLQRGASNSSMASIPTSKVPALQLEYVRKEREVKYHEALFEMLSRQFEAARLDESRDAPIVQVLDPATLPDTKTSPKRSYIMLGSLVVGLILSSCWVLLRGPVRSLRASLHRLSSA